MKRLVSLFSITALLTLAIATASPPAVAQQAGEAVAAKVNDNMISTFDMRQRMQLMMLTSGGQISESAMARLQQQVLTDLVEEKLKLQEAERLEFSVDDAEIDVEVGRIAAQSRMTVGQLGQLLAQQGISLNSLKEQIRARQVWERLVSARYGRRVNITESEIDTVVETLRADSRKEQFQLSEICLPIADPSKTREMFQAGMQIIGELRKGVPFGAMARQFSSCPSAANGGDLGWVQSAELPSELSDVITKLQPGSVSTPIPVAGTMHIVALRQKRDAAQAGERSFKIGYASAPVSFDFETAATALKEIKKANMCNEDELAVDLGENIGFEILPFLSEKVFVPEFLKSIEKLDRNQLSEPVEVDGYYHIAYLCEKDDGYGLPSRAQIENKLFAEELDLLSRRYLRDLERDASVDIMLKPQKTAAAQPAE